MRIYDKVLNLDNPTSVALGFFDGVHKGHKKVLKKALSLKNQGLSPFVFTFSQNPKEIIKKKPIMQLTTVEEKTEILDSMGFDGAFVIDFELVRDFSGEDFVKQILKDKLNAKAVVCGFNHHFGKGGTLGADDLKNICSKYGIDVYVVLPEMYKNMPISSSRIRKSILEQRTLEAKDMLGG